MRRFALAIVVAIALTAAVAQGADAAPKNGPVLFTDYNSVYRMNPDGTGIKRVVKRSAWGIDVAADGKRVAFAHDGLFLTKVSGGKVRNLLSRYPTVAGLAGVDWVSWAPNGKRLAFSGENDGRIYTIKPNGKGLQYLLGKRRTGLSHPVYSPDGREIAFLDTLNGSSLMAVNVATGKERMIYPGSGPAGTPTDFAWHPSGTRLAFYAPYRDWMINRDGSGLRQISPDAAFVSYENLVFSPDGTRLLGRSTAEGGSTSELWVMDGNYGAGPGGFANSITGGFAGSAYEPEWAPAPETGGRPTRGRRGTP